MEIQISQEIGRVPVTVLHIQGSVDAQTHQQLEDRVRQVIGNGARNVVLDMTDVKYISSYGVRALSTIFKWLRDHSDGEDDLTFSAGIRDGTYKSRHLKLANPSSSVMHVLSMTGLDMFLDIQPDLRTAIASF